jgi:uncharacterized protein (TIGR04255 family)
MPKKLPTKLRKEPILDAVFELRFSSSSPASNIFPGILFNKLDGKKVIEPHPIASVPKQIRDADQNLKYAPIVRIHWNEFLLLIGDQSIAIACKMPYPGWTKLKNVIVQVINIVKEVGIIEGIQRYSLKYVDLIPIADIKKQVSAVRLQVKLGDHALEKEVFQFRLEVEKDGLVNAIQIVSSAVVTTQDC